MDGIRAPVWLMTVDAAPGAAAPAMPAIPACSGCARPPRATSAPPPDLQGPQAVIERLLPALRQVRDPETGQDILTEGWLQGLRLGSDDAELRLWSRSSGCSAARTIAEDVFAVLRHELPDTDLYLHLMPVAGADCGGCG